MNGLVLGLAGCTGLSLCTAGALTVHVWHRRAKINRRLLALRHLARPTEAVARDVRAPLRVLARFGDLLSRSGLLSAKGLEDLRRRLAASGVKNVNALAIFIGAKAAFFVLFPLLAFAVSGSFHASRQITMLACAGAAILGLMLPDVVTQRLRTRYLFRVELGVPDTLDMMVICTEAGLNLEASIDRVSREMAQTHPETAGEFAQTVNELRVLSDRREAMTNLGARTELAPLIRLGTTLVQTVQYGTPLGQALRTLANEMRLEMLLRAEAKAARLPIMLTVPMILFILPTLFVIVVGPAALSISKAFM